MTIIISLRTTSAFFISENLSVEIHNFIHLYFSKTEIYPLMNLKTDDIHHREFTISEIYLLADLIIANFRHRNFTDSEIHLLRSFSD